MAKELPYFKFEPNQWENGNIQMLPRDDKGLFIDLCSMYWSRLGDVPLKLAIQKLCNGNAVALNSLINERIIEVIDHNIFIKFLSEQLDEFENTSAQNSKNAKERWEKHRKQKEESELNASALKPQCEINTIREEEIRVEKIKEDKIKQEVLPASPKFSFLGSLLDYGFERQLVEDWLKVRKTKKATNTETAFKNFIAEIEQRTCNINEILEVCVEKSWSGFKWTWYDNLKQQSNTFNNGRVEKTNREIFEDAIQSETARNFRFS